MYALFMSQCRTKIVEGGAIRIDDDDDDDENNQGDVKLFTSRYQEGWLDLSVLLIPSCY